MATATAKKATETTKKATPEATAAEKITQEHVPAGSTEEAATLIVTYSEQFGTLTATLKALALIVVNVRKAIPFNGRPDWKGQSAEYRAWMTSVFVASGIEGIGSDSKFGNNLRYHVSETMAEMRKSDPNMDKDLKALGITGKTTTTAGAKRSGTSPAVVTSVPPEVASAATAVASSMTLKDPAACAQAILNQIATARSYDVRPDQVDGLLMLLSSIVAQVNDWSEAVNADAQESAAHSTTEDDKVSA